jgi:hypothetical protein
MPTAARDILRDVASRHPEYFQGPQRRDGFLLGSEHEECEPSTKRYETSSMTTNL